MATNTALGLRGKRILLGVTGGIGACKSPEIARAFVREGAEVSVVMTRNAERFVTPLTMETLTRHPVGMDMFSLTEERTIGHIDRARWADLVLVAPATANYLAKAACGIADDLLSTITLAARCPLAVAPAMNSAMWEHPAVRHNLAVLEGRGALVIPPRSGELACGEEGPGRLAEPGDILAAVAARLGGGDLAGLRVLVTAGPTREPVDPVRYISNASSGKMGYALARAALSRGAEVVLVTGPVSEDPPPGAEVVRVVTARQMQESVEKALEGCSWLIMAAAVADWRVAAPSSSKDKKAGKDRLTLELVPTTDILASLRGLHRGRLFVGFAAETEALEANALAKLRSKGLDLIVANDVTLPGAGFGSDNNRAVILGADGFRLGTELVPKTELANAILDASLAAWRRAESGRA